LLNLLSNRMSIDYGEYITSESWLETAERAKKRDGGCLVCRRRTDLNVHHGTYRHLSEELDAELFTLCQYHHRKLHDRFGRARRRKEKVSLLSFTRRFIRRNSRPLPRKDRLSSSAAPSVTPKKKSKAGAFDGPLARMSIGLPKMEAVATETVRFRSRNQMKVEEIRERKRIRRERRAERRIVAHGTGSRNQPSGL